MSNPNELFDVVNEQDEVIGQATRGECHSNPQLIHHTIHYTLRDAKTGKIFLSQRGLTKETDPGKFCFGGEHINAGESYEHALVRGIEEELGFTPTKWEQVDDYLFKQEKQTEIARFYVAEWNGEPLVWDKEEFENVFWVEPKKEAFTGYDLGTVTAHWVERIWGAK